MAKNNTYRSKSHYRGKSRSTNSSSNFGTDSQSSKTRYNLGGNTKGTNLLVENTSNFNWTVPSGTPVAAIYGQPSSTATFKNESFPVLMTFSVQPTLGIARNVDSPAHRLALMLYNDVVKINSVNAPYDPVDIEKYVLAMANLSAYIEWVKRIYRIAGTYSAMNRSIPQVLLSANGVNGTDIRKYMSDFRKSINLFIRAASTLMVPAGIPYFDQFDELMSNVYVDEESPKAQMYMFVPDVFYKYDELGDTTDPSAYTGARLLPLPIFDQRNSMISNHSHYQNQFNLNGVGTTADWVPRSGGLTADAILNLGWEILNPLLNSQDIYRLQADISKTYGDGSMRKFSELEADETLIVNYDASMLRQIENLRITGHAYQYTNSGSSGESDLGNRVGNYYPMFAEVAGINKGYLTFTYYPNFYHGNDNVSAQTKSLIVSCMDSDSVQILNSHKDIPSPSDAFEMCKFIPTIDEEYIDLDENHSIWVNDIDTCGLFLIVDCKIYTRYWRDGEIGTTYIDYPWYIIPAQSDTTANVVRKFTAMDKFDWHPMIQYIRYDANYSVKDILLDVDVFAEVPSRNIANTHEVRILDAFNVPGSTYSLS